MAESAIAEIKNELGLHARAAAQFVQTANKFNASVTPEVYVLNNEFQQLYHGRIDDSRKKNKVEKQDLRNVLDEIIAGKKVSVKETKAFGCSIKRVKK